MPMDQGAQGRAESTTASAAKPLPKGYLWRLMIILPLLLGASFCFILVNHWLGVLLFAAGMAFGKLSGLNATLADHQRSGAAE